ncbi:unnamed protein product [Effrenium voratum]|nr:unnamed protein product [Effrenium voratum]
MVNRAFISQPGLMRGVADEQQVWLPALQTKDWLTFAPPVRSNRRIGDIHSFLSLDAGAKAASRGQQEDFLFGLSASSAPDITKTRSSAQLPTPTQSMMQAVVALPTLASGFIEAALPKIWSVVQPVVDPFSDEKEGEKETGWCKFIPRVLRVFYWSDIITGGVLAHSLYYVCDVPLRTWLLGGLLLGFPATDMVHRMIMKDDPRFKIVRFTIKKLRSGADPENFKIDSVVLYNRCGGAIHRSLVDERHEANYWFVDIRDGPELVTAYQIVTHRIEGPECDPSSWIVEGSVDGVTWHLVDECNGESLPRQRETASQQFDDLMHMPDAQAAFRQGFLAEVAACAGSFAWLVLGTSWVSAGTDACVDSAPYLWYWSYFLVVVIWSFLGTITIGLIVCAVAMIVVGGKTP